MLIHKGKESIEILAKREGLDILLSSSHSLDTTLLHRCDSVRHSNRLHSLLSISLSVLCITPDSLISHRESGKMSLAEAPRPRIPSLCTTDGLSRSCFVPNTSRSPRQTFVRVGTFSGVGVCKSSRLFGLQEHRMHAPSRVQDKKHRKRKCTPRNSRFQTSLQMSLWNCYLKP